MRPSEIVQLEVIAKGARTKAFEDVYDLIDRELERSRDNGDQHAVEIYEILRAKIKGMEAGKYMGGDR